MSGKKTFLICSVLVLGLASNVSAVLVAHYEFEGNANDSVGGYHGMLMGDAKYGTGPEYGGVSFGQAISLDGDWDYVLCGGTFASVTASASKTIMAWVNSNTIDYSGSIDMNGRIITLYRDDGYSGFTILAVGNPATWQSVYAKGVNDWEWLDSKVPVTADEWTHIALVQNGADVNIYINGILENSVSEAAVPPVYSPPNADIGAFDQGGNTMRNFFSGSIDDVRIYNHALTKDEIQAVIPEPATAFLLGIGALLFRKRRHQ